jgi:hypothetical protein
MLHQSARPQRVGSRSSPALRTTGPSGSFAGHKRRARARDRRMPCPRIIPCRLRPLASSTPLSDHSDRAVEGRRPALSAFQTVTASATADLGLDAPQGADDGASSHVFDHKRDRIDGFGCLEASSISPGQGCQARRSSPPPGEEALWPSRSPRSPPRACTERVEAESAQLTTSCSYIPSA